MKAFFVKGRNKWGYSKESLYDAMRKAGIRQSSPLEVYAEAIDEAIHSDEDASEFLQDAACDLEATTRAYETEFQVQVVPVEWELANVSSIDGTPSWENAEQGDSTTFLCEVDESGKIHIKQ